MGDGNDGLKFKDQDFISNKKFFEMFMKLDSTVDEILQTLNNGLKTDVRRNSKEISKLKNKVGSLDDTISEKINTDNAKKEGRAYIREFIAYFLAALANLGLILSLLDII